MTASVEVQVARGALMEIGRADLAPLIFGDRTPCWDFKAAPMGCWATVAQAMVLGHQVHDRSAHLSQVKYLSVCCPSCGLGCDEHVPAVES